MGEQEVETKFFDNGKIVAKVKTAPDDKSGMTKTKMLAICKDIFNTIEKGEENE